MTTGAIVQARMGSQRLPNKVLMRIGRSLVLERIVDRLRQCKNLDVIVVATSTLEEDNPIADWCSDKGISCFRGPSEDVLARYYQAAVKFGISEVVRITGDCPLIDPLVIDKVVLYFQHGNYDAAALHGGFPDGLDCQVFTFDALELAWSQARGKVDREHVGSFIEHTRPDLFSFGKVELFRDLGHHRWTLDEPKDLKFLKLLIEGLEGEAVDFYTCDILSYLDRFPSLLEINSGIIRNEGYLLSLRREIQDA